MYIYAKTILYLIFKPYCTVGEKNIGAPKIKNKFFMYYEILYLFNIAIAI